MPAASRRLAAPSLPSTLATWKEAVRGLMNKLRGDFRVGEALAEEGQHLPFTPGQVELGCAHAADGSEPSAAAGAPLGGISSSGVSTAACSSWTALSPTAAAVSTPSASASA